MLLPASASLYWSYLYSHSVCWLDALLFPHHVSCDVWNTIHVRWCHIGHITVPSSCVMWCLKYRTCQVVSHWTHYCLIMYVMCWLKHLCVLWYGKHFTCHSDGWNTVCVTCCHMLSDVWNTIFHSDVWDTAVWSTVYDMWCLMLCDVWNIVCVVWCLKHCAQLQAMRCLIRKHYMCRCDEMRTILVSLWCQKRYVCHSDEGSRACVMVIYEANRVFCVGWGPLVFCTSNLHVTRRGRIKLESSRLLGHLWGFEDSRKHADCKTEHLKSPL